MIFTEAYSLMLLINHRKETNTMTIFNRKITDEDMFNIASYMDDEIREHLHFELAPCSNEEFLKRYLELDPDFEELLESEFNFAR